ncbi:MAG: zinc ribbon domain-containing protein [Longimicrobiales bacterium]|nr:zinc ribbon domain-containing protein [Longimicrobiales bacterium]
MTSEASIVERLYEALVEEVSRTRPELLQESFTVAEIYQNLVPYRTHRERVGAEMNGDYEHALLRLLAGEGGYVTLESDAARERLEDELNSVHPDTGVYRNFAACEVRLRPERLEDLGVPLDLEGPSGDEGSPEDDTPVDGVDGSEETDEESVRSADSVSESESTAEPETGSPTERGLEELASPDAGADNGADRPADDSEVAEARESTGGSGDGAEAEPSSEPGSGEDAPPEGDSPGTCLWCRETLPERDDLRFCPFCGSSVDLRPCPECGAEVESDWIFCIACGTEATG